MHVRFMGTGAADFSPRLKTDLSDKLDRDARRSSSVLIGGTLLIDCGPHVTDSFRIQGLEASRVTDLLLTHLHDDHFLPDRAAALAADCRGALRIWYRAGAEIAPIPGAEMLPVQPGETFDAGGYTVRALAANHTAYPLHYDIEGPDGARLFYGCDGAWVLYDTFYAMRRREYDGMILDATVGDYTGDFRLGEHNSIPMIRLMTASFKTERVLATEGKVCLSHIARTLHAPHAELAAAMEKEGYLTAYDGMQWEIAPHGDAADGEK